MTQTLAPVTLPDARLSAMLRLAMWAADRPEDAGFYDAPAIAAGLVPNLNEPDARAGFGNIVEEMVDAIDLDTHGGAAVIERLGRWDPSVGMTADEKADEMAAELRDSARFAAQMLITTSDKLAT